METGVEAVPIKLWHWGIQHCAGALRAVPEQKVRLALMPTGNASVTSRGVRFKGLYYSSREMVDGLWFEKARSKGSYRVSVSYDPRDMGKSMFGTKRMARPSPAACWTGKKSIPASSLVKCSMNRKKKNWNRNGMRPRKRRRSSILDMRLILS